MVAVSSEVGCSNSCPAFATVILEDADVLEALIALQVLNALRRQPQKLPDLDVARIPELAVVFGIFDQHFMRADRAHAIVQTVPTPRRLTFDPVQRCGMDHCPRRPRRTNESVMAETTCAGVDESGQNGQGASGAANGSGTSSPVITHDRVMGSLRSSMVEENTTIGIVRQL